MAHSTAEFTQLMVGILIILGEDGARSILYHGGINAFNKMQQEMPSLFKIEGIEVKTTEQDKAFDSFVHIAEIITSATKSLFGDIVSLELLPEGLAYDISPCFWCVGLKSNHPICHAQTGFDVGFARWVMGKNAVV